MASQPNEPCVSCGEETAIGTVFYSDRRVVDHPKRGKAYLCELCSERLAAAKRGRRLTDEEIRQFTNNASAAAMTWANQGR